MSEEPTKHEEKESERHVRRFNAKTSRIREDELLDMLAHVEIHPAASMLPDLKDEEYQALVQSIRESGLQEPIVFWDGKLIDGRHRMKACLEAKRRIKAVQLYNVSESQMIQWLIGHHIGRRHLDPSQRAIIAADMVIARVKAARIVKGKSRSVAIARVKPKGKPADEAPSLDPVDETVDTEVKDEFPDLEALPRRHEQVPLKVPDAAKGAGVSRRAVERAVKTRLSGTEETNRAMESGDISLSLADKVARLPKNKQDEFWVALRLALKDDPDLDRKRWASEWIASRVDEGDLEGKAYLSVTMTFRTRDPRFFDGDGKPVKEKVNENLSELARQAEFLGFKDIKYAAKFVR